MVPHPNPLSLLCAVAGLCLVAACSTVANQKQSELSASSKMRLAEAADRDGNVEAALSMYQDAASSAPSNVPAQLHYADALARNGRITQAQRLLAQQLKVNPEQREVARASALLDIMVGNTSDAILKLDRLIATDPHDEHARMDKGVALDLLGRHTDAQEQYRRVVADDPNNISVKNNMAVSMMLEGRQRDAQNLLQPVGEAYDAPARVKVNLAILYAANGDIARAQELVKGQLDQGELMTFAKRINQASSSKPPSR
jgi:Flp pilus assembly protein TadD